MFFPACHVQSSLKTQTGRAKKNPDISRSDSFFMVPIGFKTCEDFTERKANYWYVREKRWVTKRFPFTRQVCLIAEAQEITQPTWTWRAQRTAGGWCGFAISVCAHFTNNRPQPSLRHGQSPHSTPRTHLLPHLLNSSFFFLDKSTFNFSMCFDGAMAWLLVTCWAVVFIWLLWVQVSLCSGHSHSLVIRKMNKRLDWGGAESREWISRGDRVPVQNREDFHLGV